jgi:hypothetical protein
MSDQPNPGTGHNPATPDEAEITGMLIAGMGRVTLLQSQILEHMQMYGFEARAHVDRSQLNDHALMAAQRQSLDQLDRLETLTKKALAILDQFVRDID